MRRSLFYILLTMVLTACDGYTGGSSISNIPVQLEVNTLIHTAYGPNNATAWFTVDGRGYRNEQGQLFQALQMTDYYGHAGVFVVVGFDQKYYAYDLMCPVCRMVQLTPDSYARVRCHSCGEEFVTDYGSGYPTKGIAKEGLKRYSVSYYNNIIHVRN